MKTYKNYEIRKGAKGWNIYAPKAMWSPNGYFYRTYTYDSTVDTLAEAKAAITELVNSNKVSK